MDYENTIKYLYGLQVHGIKLGLDNPIRLLSMLGNPHEWFRSVHLAGTNGKGSTAAMLASVLTHAGEKTGLFTSPHLVSFTERIRVDGAEITPAEVVSLASEIREAADTAGLEPTFFEVVTAMGFLHFKRKGVDWAVIETGMGGRLDATNVLAPTVSIITPVSMDHAQFLGNKLGEVAREKAGIIKKGVPVVSSEQEHVVIDAIIEKTDRLFLEGRDFKARVTSNGKGSVLFDYISPDLSLKDLTIGLSGANQAQNAALAVKAFELASVTTKEKIESTIRNALGSLQWPGRLELINTTPTVLVDGAHNPAAAEALARTLVEDYGISPSTSGEKLTLVAGVMSDKDIRGILSPLLPLASGIIFTAPDYGRAAQPESLVDLASEMGHEGARAVFPVSRALEEAALLGRTILVTGSFYVAGAAKEALGAAAGFGIGLRE